MRTCSNREEGATVVSQTLIGLPHHAYMCYDLDPDRPQPVPRWTVTVLVVMA
jgi:hypothetical protein